jgi:hypothetical protein
VEQDQEASGVWHTASAGRGHAGKSLQSFGAACASARWPHRPGNGGASVGWWAYSDSFPTSARAGAGRAGRLTGKTPGPSRKRRRETSRCPRRSCSRGLHLSGRGNDSRRSWSAQGGARKGPEAPGRCDPPGRGKGTSALRPPRRPRRRPAALCHTQRSKRSQTVLGQADAAARLFRPLPGGSRPSVCFVSVHARWPSRVQSSKKGGLWVVPDLSTSPAARRARGPVENSFVWLHAPTAAVAAYFGFSAPTEAKDSRPAVRTGESVALSQRPEHHAHP